MSQATAGFFRRLTETWGSRCALSSSSGLSPYAKTKRNELPRTKVLAAASPALNRMVRVRAPLVLLHKTEVTRLDEEPVPKTGGGPAACEFESRGFRSIEKKREGPVA